MIVVSGATGNVGSELLRLLSARGEPVRALFRNPPAEPSLRGVEWVRAELTDRTALAAALEGGRALFLLTGNTADMVPAQKNAIAAASRAGVERIVKLSALGASDHSKSVIGLWHWVVEQALEEAPPEWTILRPHVFMQNVLDQRDSIRGRGEVRSPAGDAATAMIDARDIAAVAAAALTGDGHAGKRYTLTGPAPLTWHEVARVLSEVLGREIVYVAETEDEAWSRLHGAGQPPWLIGAQLALAEYQRAGGGTSIVTRSVEEITGRPPRTFRDFAADHAQLLA